MDQNPPLLPAQSSVVEKPGMFNAISIMSLVNGIINVIYGLALTAGIVCSTLGIGLLCAPLTILPTVLGIFEIIYAAKLLSNPPKPIQPSIVLGILEICCVLWGNLISPVVGILNLVFYNDDSVKAYFAQINSQEAVQS